MADRITVQLTPDAAAKLKKLVSRTRRTQAAIVATALSLMEYIESETAKGKEVIIKDSKGNEVKLKRL